MKPLIPSQLLKMITLRKTKISQVKNLEFNTFYCHDKIKLNKFMNGDFKPQLCKPQAHAFLNHEWELT